MDQVLDLLGTSLKLTVPGDQRIVSAPVVLSKLGGTSHGTGAIRKAKQLVSTPRKYSTMCNYLDKSAFNYGLRAKTTHLMQPLQLNFTLQLGKFYSVVYSGLRFIKKFVKR